MVTQPSLRRLADFGVRPKRDLGQNFLIDSNILGVIDRAAELGPEDVVLEIGGGLGVLSEHLAPLSRHVHVVEIDRALEAPLREALEAHPNTTLHIADALDLDLTALDPLPTKVVANLPYGIAATAILRTVEDLPGVERWVAMVQKEVGQRFAAKEGTDAYGVPSVLAQLSCDVRVLRPVSRTVFHPVPNVDSVLVGLVRTGPPVDPALRAFVQAAFAHRRKALARSLALAGLACPPAVGRPRPRPGRAARARPSRRCARGAPLAGGLPGLVGEGLRVTVLHARAPAKINLCLLVGPVRDHDGRHELVSVMDTVSLADDLVLEPADGGADEVVCAGVEGPNLVAAAIEAFRARIGWDGAPVRITVTKRIPVAGGMAGGSADAAATLRLLAAHAGTGDDALEELATPLGADVPSQIRGGRVLATGAGERLEPAAPGRPLRRPRPAGRRCAVHARGLRGGRPRRAAHARRARGGPRAAAHRRRPVGRRGERPAATGPHPLPGDRRRARRRRRGGRRRDPRVRLRADGARAVRGGGRAGAGARRRRRARRATARRDRGRARAGGLGNGGRHRRASH